MVTTQLSDISSGYQGEQLSLSLILQKVQEQYSYLPEEAIKKHFGEKNEVLSQSVPTSTHC